LEDVEDLREDFELGLAAAQAAGAPPAAAS
jgi:hypothetical protein